VKIRPWSQFAEVSGTFVYIMQNALMMEACDLTGTSIMSATWPATTFGLMKPRKLSQAKFWTWTIASPRRGRSAGQRWAGRLLGGFLSSCGLYRTTARIAQLLLIRPVRALSPSTTVPSGEQEPTE